MVRENPDAYLKRFRELQVLCQPGYCNIADPTRYAPPFPGAPEWGCIGCEHSLPWQTSFHMKDERGKSAVVDAHDCWGPEPVTEKGKAVAATTFQELQRIYSLQR